MWTLKLLVEALSASPPLPAATGAVAFATIITLVAIASVAAAASRVATIWGGGGGGFSRTHGGVHFVRELGLNLAQVRRVPCMHGEDLRRHRRWVGLPDVVCRGGKTVRALG